MSEIFVDPLPAGAQKEDALYPEGAHLTDLGEVRELLYKMQRPAIAPGLVYPHDWCAQFNSSFVTITNRHLCRRPKDLVLFHNRGVLHTVVGAFKLDQVRAFHQCNLAASDDPIGPNAEDVRAWA